MSAQENGQEDDPARLRAAPLSRRQALAILAAPFAAPVIVRLFGQVGGMSEARAQTGTGPVIPPAAQPLIRAHQTALLFPPQFSGGNTRLALSLEGGNGAPLRLPYGPPHTLRLVNDLLHAIIPRLRGIGASAPTPINPGATADLVLKGLRAGTHLVELRGPQAAKALNDQDATNAAWPVLPLIVAPPHGTTGLDAPIRDEVLLIEEWPAAGKGTGAGDPGTASPNIPLTANREPRADLAAPAGGNLRLRLINATPRRMLSFLLPDMSPSVIAIDGEDAEPFPPRDRQIVLAPGNRMDVLLSFPAHANAAQGPAAPILVHDGIRARTIALIRIAAPDALPDAHPASPPPTSPQSGIAAPERPNLTGAQRVELAFMPPLSDHTANAGPWRLEDAPAPASPAFTAVRGRTISLALRNDFAAPIAIHIGGHRARLLDRLDDGWKPFWLDTIAVEPGETIRLAFVTPNAGIWDIEATVLAVAPPSAGSEKPSAGTNGAFRFVATFSVT